MPQEFQIGLYFNRLDVNYVAKRLEYVRIKNEFLDSCDT